MKVIEAKVFRTVMIVCLLVAMPTWADSGTVDILTSALSSDTSVQMGGTTVTARGGNGTITVVQSSGAPFVEGTSGRTLFTAFSKKSSTGFELEADGLATFASGDTLQLLFKRRTGDLAAGTSGEGTLYLPGGTGAFAGISGECRYKVENLPGNWNVTIAHCSWKK